MPRPFYFSGDLLKPIFFFIFLCCYALLANGKEGDATLKLKDSSIWITSFSDGVSLDSISSSISPSGDQRLWFSLDRKMGVKDNFRTELRGRIPGLTEQLNYGNTYSVDFTLLIPDNWQSDTEHEVVWQLHRAVDEKEKEQGSAPIFSLSILQNGIYSMSCYSTVEGWDRKTQKCIKSGQLDYIKSGGSYRIHLDFKLSSGNEKNGFIKISVNDVPRFNHEGAFGYGDARGPYMKFGIYKGSWSAKKSKITSTNFRRYGFENMKIIKVVQPIQSSGALKINGGSSGSDVQSMVAQKNKTESQQINMEAQLNQLKAILARIKK